MNITFLGVGKVGAPLAGHLVKAGHRVTIAARDPQSESVQKALAAYPGITALPVDEALAEAEVVFLATPFAANEAVLRPIADAMAGKVLVDCTNPVGAGLTHGLNNEKSGSEFVQSLVPKASVVKAFTIYGFENFKNPAYPAYNVKPAMFFCGDNKAAKERVAQLVKDCGFEPLDVGGLVQALHLEHMTLMWVRMVRVGGRSPHLVWAALQR